MVSELNLNDSARWNMNKFEQLKKQLPIGITK